MMPSSSPLASWRHQLLAGLLACALVIGLWRGGSLALWGLGGGVLLYVLETLRLRRPPPLHPAALGFALSFLLLVIIADIAPLAPERSWPMSWRLATIVIPLLLLFPSAMPPVVWPRWFDAAGWVLLASLLLLLIELASGGALLLLHWPEKDGRLVVYNRGLSYMAVLVWPLLALLAVKQRWRLAAGLLVLLMTAAWVSASRGAPLALAAGAVMAALGWRRPRWAAVAALALLLIVAGLSLLLPALIFDTHADWVQALPPSWQHRLEIWDYMLAWHWREPWLGDGVDAAGVVPLGDHSALYRYALGPAAHPHHAFLQALLELGWLGWFWSVALALFILREAMRLPAPARAAALAAWAAYLTLACGAFSFWSDSYLATGAVALLFCRAAAQSLRPSLPKSGN